MTVGLEKFVLDVKNEKVLWQSQEPFKTEEKEAAWKKISSTNKMSVKQAKSIFSVLYKKYHHEKSKGNSNWKLYQFLTFLDKTNEEEASNHDEEDEEMEEDGEFIELLEVTEDFGSKENSGDEDNFGPKGKTINKSEKLTETPAQNRKKYGEKKEVASTNQIDQLKREEHKPNLSKIDSQQLLKVLKAQKQKHQNQNQNSPPINQKTDLKKFPGLTILRSPYPPHAKAPKGCKQIDTKVSTNVVNEKESTGLETVKKLPPFENFLKRKIVPASAAAVIENGKSQDLHQAIDEETPPAKRASKEVQEKMNMKSTSETQSSSRLEPGQTRSETEISKKDIRVEGTKLHGDASANSNIKNNKRTYNEIKSKIAQGMNSSNSTSHIKNDSPKIEVKQEEDSEDDSEENSNAESTNSSIEKKGHENYCSNELLPKFFHDLYKSKTYDSFGMYVSSALNRLPLNLARKLELKILQSILEINSMNTE